MDHNWEEVSVVLNWEGRGYPESSYPFRLVCDLLSVTWNSFRSWKSEGDLGLFKFLETGVIVSLSISTLTLKERVASKSCSPKLMKQS